MEKKKVVIVIDGKKYPCRPTMGAMLDFKEETGKEVTEIDGGITDMFTYLYCCIKSACRRDGIEFGLSRTEFADSITPDDMAKWTAMLDDGTAPSDGDSSKKKKQ